MEPAPPRLCSHLCVPPFGIQDSPLGGRSPLFRAFPTQTKDQGQNLRNGLIQSRRDLLPHLDGSIKPLGQGRILHDVDVVFLGDSFDPLG